MVAYPFQIKRIIGNKIGTYLPNFCGILLESVNAGGWYFEMHHYEIPTSSDKEGEKIFYFFLPMRMFCLLLSNKFYYKWKGAFTLCNYGSSNKNFNDFRSHFFKDHETRMKTSAIKQMEPFQRDSKFNRYYSRLISWKSKTFYAWFSSSIPTYFRFKIITTYNLFFR